LLLASQENKFFYNRFRRREFLSLTPGHPSQWRPDMKMISTTAIASAIALSVIAFGATGAAKAGPIVPAGHYCLEEGRGGTDCGFTNYAQCEATASGTVAECYGSAARDDAHLRRQGPGLLH
jgi:hypothetical protein